MTKLEAPVYNLQGQPSGTVTLDPAIFDVKLNPGLVQMAVTVQRANRREPIAHTKMRGEVRGGGRKPWRQKGTGRARHGSRRSPIWRGGGVTFGPRSERNFKLKINHKARRKALCMVLTAKRSDGQMRVVEPLELQPAKTKTLHNLLRGLKVERGGLLVSAKPDRQLRRAAANLKSVQLISADSLNVYDVLKARTLIVAKAALPVIERMYRFQVVKPV